MSLGVFLNNLGALSIVLLGLLGLLLPARAAQFTGLQAQGPKTSVPWCSKRPLACCCCFPNKDDWLPSGGFQINIPTHAPRFFHISHVLRWR